MSSSFTIHLPRDASPGDERALDRAEIVRDGFSWGAFFVPTLWFLWHRHWIVAVIVLLGTLGLSFGLAALRLPGGAIFLVEFLVHLLIGLEGASIRRLAYRLRKRPTTGLVIAADEAEAETKSFAQWLAAAGHKSLAPAETPAPVRVAPAIRPAGAAPAPVLGLFPDFEGRR
ncbi:DUF2628 domain-containing protein [Enterovirga sp. CN4-39]|uniref:DUF2628 domain-containing protein n=1 Tax=Enterovirga sp. CN4-39 TaxID=3400910 RepID=UPI003C07D593